MKRSAFGILRFASRVRCSAFLAIFAAKITEIGTESKSRGSKLFEYQTIIVRIQGSPGHENDGIKRGLPGQDSAAAD